MSADPRTVQDRLDRDRAARARAIVRDPVVRTVAAVGLGWIAGYASLIGATWDSPERARFVQVILCLVPFLALAALVLAMFRRSTGRRRTMWRLFAAASLSTLTAMVLWAAAAYVPSLSWAVDLSNLLLAGAILLCVPGYLLGFGGLSVVRQARHLVDAGLLAVTLGTLGWYLLVMPRLSRTLDANGWFDIAFVLLDLAVLSVLFSGGLAGHRTVPHSILLWAAGLIVGGLTDALVSYFSIGQPSGDGGWANVGWQTEGILMLLGTLVAYRHDEPEAQPHLMDRDFSVPLLILPACGVALVLVKELGDTHAGALAVLLVMITGPMLRQLLVIRDRTRLGEALAASLHEQERLATTDGLTGVQNRRSFNEALRAEGERAARSGQPVAVILLDLDRFKQVNDLHGHPAGDAVLVETAARVQATVRAGDVVARFGGEEFAVLLADGDEDRAHALAERIRLAVRADPVAVPDGPLVSVSGSFGVATALIAADRLDHDLDRLVRRADQALYQAKESGRDCTRVAPPPGQPADAAQPVPPDPRRPLQGEGATPAPGRLTASG